MQTQLWANVKTRIDWVILCKQCNEYLSVWIFLGQEYEDEYMGGSVAQEKMIKHGVITHKRDT